MYQENETEKFQDDLKDREKPAYPTFSSGLNSGAGKKKIRVLIVDDSAVVRLTLAQVLSSDPSIEVMAAVGDPYLAADRIRKEKPDVITLDVEMPRMDGLTFLQKLMSQHPLPVVICSTLVGRGSESALRALEYGAVDIIQKPRMGSKEFLLEAQTLICDAVKGAASARVRPYFKPQAIEPKLSADVVLPKARSDAMVQTTDKVVVIGASTGGTEAIRVLLEAMPYDAPGIVIVQHMPEHFTAAFANRLDSLCRITVREAQNGDAVLRGRALISPGNRHLMLRRSGAKYYVETHDGEMVSRHRPSVDVLFRSAARYCGKNALGIILTGMGDDGAHGLLELKEAGAQTLAQDESTSIVFGMPAEAIRLGAAGKVLKLNQIAAEALRICQTLAES